MTGDTDNLKCKTDYYGRVKGWKLIKKKPFNYIASSLGVRFCSKCGRLCMDTWSMFCSLDGKFLINSEQLDFERRKMLGFDKPSHFSKEMLVDA